MADWLRLSNGHYVNMDRIAAVRGGENDDLNLVTPEGNVIVVGRAEAPAVRDYIERVHQGERTAEERPPRGRDNPIVKG